MLTGTQVWIYDQNKVFTGESKFVDEVGANMTTVALLVGHIKPTFNEELQEWFEGATQQEIDEWYAQNTPKNTNLVNVHLLNGSTGNITLEKQNNTIFISGKIESELNSIVGRIPLEYYPTVNKELNNITINTNGTIVSTGNGVINGFYTI